MAHKAASLATKLLANLPQTNLKLVCYDRLHQSAYESPLHEWSIKLGWSCIAGWVGPEDVEHVCKK